MNEHRQGSVRATTVCFVFCLSREDFNTVLNRFPTLRVSLEARARERLQELYLSERQPLETILALFSDPSLKSSSEDSISEIELSDILRAAEAETDAQESDGATNQIASTCTSSMLAPPILEESYHSVTTPTLGGHHQLPYEVPHQSPHHSQ